MQTDTGQCELFKRAIIDALPNSIAVINRDGTIIAVNKAWCDFADMNGSAHIRQTSLGCNYLEVCRQSVAADSPMADEALTGIVAVLAGRQDSFVMIYPCHSREKQAWYQMSVTLLPVDLQAAVISHTDITSLKQHEKSLRKLSRAVQQSPVCIVITDVEGTVEFVNPSFTKMTGYRSDEVIGKNPRLLKSGKMLPALYQHLWQTISTGQTWEGELHNSRKDGSTYWAHATISPIRNHSGQITHYLAIKEDITEKKLLRDQLIQAQKMESVGQLAGGLAHDFNNLLSIINGYASLLQLKLDDREDLQRLAQNIQNATEKAATLTHGLLAYSRQQIMLLQQHDLGQLVKTAQEFISKILGDTIELCVTTTAAPLMINADSQQIEQVLYNLATNARDAMTENGRFSIETSAVPDDDQFLVTSGYGSPEDYALLTVTDNGAGMDKETLKRLFDPFFTTKQVGKGTGLGLSMAYGIIRQHNGYVQVQSKPGKGTVFWIYLPLSLAADTNADEPDEPQ